MARSKTTAARAARDVAESADRLSAELLEQERLAATRITREFSSRVPVVTYRTVRGIRNSMPTRNRWVADQQEALDACTEHARTLGERAAELARIAIRRELLALEKSLPARHAGLSLRATDGMPLRGTVSRAVAVFDTALVDLPARYRAVQTYALGRADTVEELSHVLFALPARGRRGAWWNSCTAAQTQARWLSIAVANAVRLDGMRRFNEAAA